MVKRNTKNVYIALTIQTHICPFEQYVNRCLYTLLSNSCIQIM